MLVYRGIGILQSPKAALFAYALIFASFSHLRWIQNLTGRGDELALAQQWFGLSNQPIVAGVVFLIGLPPVIAAFRAIANRRRWLTFAVSYLLPLPVLAVLLIGSHFLFEASDAGMRYGSVLGIYLPVLVTDLLAAISFFYSRLAIHLP